MAGMLTQLLGSAGKAGGEILGRQNELDERMAAQRGAMDYQADLDAKKQAALQAFQSRNTQQQQEHEAKLNKERIEAEDKRSVAKTAADDARYDRASGDTKARLAAEADLKKWGSENSTKDLPATAKAELDLYKNQAENLAKLIAAESDSKAKEALQAQLDETQGLALAVIRRSQIGRGGSGERAAPQMPGGADGQPIKVSPDKSGKWEAKEGSPEFAAIKDAVMQRGSDADKRLVSDRSAGKKASEPQARGLISRMADTVFPSGPEFERYHAMDDAMLEQIASSDKDPARREKAKLELARRRRDPGEGSNRLNEIPLY